MSQRITVKDLEFLCERLNEETNSPKDSYTVGQDKRLKANVGNYHLSRAYGGVKLVRMSNEGGGVSEPISMGYETKKDAYNLILAFLHGIQSK
jgi:hypothetical protein